MKTKVKENTKQQCRSVPENVNKMQPHVILNFLVLCYRKSNIYLYKCTNLTNYL